MFTSLGALRIDYFPKTVRQCISHWVHTIILILGESLLAIKPHLIMMSFLTMPTSFSLVKRKYVVGKIAKPGAVPISTGAYSFATAKSNNSSN